MLDVQQLGRHTSKVSLEDVSYNGLVLADPESHSCDDAETSNADLHMPRIVIKNICHVLTMPTPCSSGCGSLASALIVEKLCRHGHGCWRYVP